MLLKHNLENDCLVVFHCHQLTNWTQIHKPSQNPTARIPSQSLQKTCFSTDWESLAYYCSQTYCPFRWCFFYHASSSGWDLWVLVEAYSRRLLMVRLECCQRIPTSCECCPCVCYWLAHWLSFGASSAPQSVDSSSYQLVDGVGDGVADLTDETSYCHCPLPKSCWRLRLSSSLSHSKNQSVGIPSLFLLDKYGF